MNLLIAVLAFLVTSSGWAQTSNDAFFPLQKGASWVYETTNKQKKEHFDMKVVVEGPWEENGTSGMILTQKDKRGTMREFLTRDPEKGIFISKLGLSKGYTPEVFTRFTPPVPRVIYPLQPGTK